MIVPEDEEVAHLPPAEALDQVIISRNPTDHAAGTHTPTNTPIAPGSEALMDDVGIEVNAGTPDWLIW